MDLTVSTFITNAARVAIGATDRAASSAGAASLALVKSEGDAPKAAVDLAVRDARTAVSAIDHYHATLRVPEFRGSWAGAGDKSGLLAARKQVFEGVKALRSPGLDGRSAANVLTGLAEARDKLLKLPGVDGVLSDSKPLDWLLSRTRAAVDSDQDHLLASLPPKIDDDVRTGLADPEAWLRADAEEAAPAASATPPASSAPVEVAASAHAPVRAASFTLQGLPKDSPLDKFGRDFTMEAAAGKIDPAFGREREIGKISDALGRRTKNNAMMLGEPGVGKTAVVEGLAHKIVTGDVSERMANRRIIGLDIGSMMSGGSAVGEVEKRWQEVFGQLDQLREQGESPIVFIDELHNAMGGAQSASGSTAELLKPRLARGNSNFIGATTKAEHTKLVEENEAFDRRWQPVDVDEFNVDQTTAVLRQMRSRYITHHKISITDGALAKASELADRYVNNRYLPDKAIDLVDAAMSRASNGRAGKPAELVEALSARRELQSELRTAERSGASDATMGALRTRLGTASSAVDELTSRVAVEQEPSDRVAAQAATIEDIGTRIDEARAAGNEARAIAIEQDELAPARQQLASLRNEFATVVGDRPALVPGEVTENEIAAELERITGIPASRLGASDKERLLGMDDRIKGRVIGQDHAVEEVTAAIRRNRAGVSDPNRPTGTFLFLGPTGVGKTELAKAISAELFDDEERGMVRIDFGDFKTTMSLPRLTGSGNGYKDSEKGGQLTEPLRKNPYRVVLMDEFEKAHADVADTLLPILDEGKTQDALGRPIDFRNSVLIATSNATREELQAKYRPEFLNRFDGIIDFNDLAPAHMGRIADGKLAQVVARVAPDSNNGLQVSVQPAARDALAKWGYEPGFGARPLNRTIQKQVEDLITDGVLAHDIGTGDAVDIRLADSGDRLELWQGDTKLASSKPAATA